MPKIKLLLEVFEPFDFVGPGGINALYAFADTDLDAGRAPLWSSDDTKEYLTVTCTPFLQNGNQVTSLSLMSRAPEAECSLMEGIAAGRCQIVSCAILKGGVKWTKETSSLDARSLQPLLDGGLRATLYPENLAPGETRPRLVPWPALPNL